MRYKLASHYERRLLMAEFVVFRFRDQAWLAVSGLFVMRRMAMMLRA
jgi:hypothetical protein